MRAMYEADNRAEAQEEAVAVSRAVVMAEARTLHRLQGRQMKEAMRKEAERELAHHEAMAGKWREVLQAVNNIEDV